MRAADILRFTQLRDIALARTLDGAGEPSDGAAGARADGGRTGGGICCAGRCHRGAGSAHDRDGDRAVHVTRIVVATALIIAAGHIAVVEQRRLKASRTRAVDLATQVCALVGSVAAVTVRVRAPIRTVVEVSEPAALVRLAEVLEALGQRAAEAADVAVSTVRASRGAAIRRWCRAECAVIYGCTRRLIDARLLRKVTTLAVAPRRFLGVVVISEVPPAVLEESKRHARHDCELARHGRHEIRAVQPLLPVRAVARALRCGLVLELSARQ